MVPQTSHSSHLLDGDQTNILNARNPWDYCVMLKIGDTHRHQVDNVAAQLQTQWPQSNENIIAAMTLAIVFSQEGIRIPLSTVCSLCRVSIADVQRHLTVMGDEHNIVFTKLSAGDVTPRLATILGLKFQQSVASAAAALILDETLQRKHVATRAATAVEMVVEASRQLDISHSAVNADIPTIPTRDLIARAANISLNTLTNAYREARPLMTRILLNKQFEQTFKTQHSGQHAPVSQEQWSGVLLVWKDVGDGVYRVDDSRYNRVTIQYFLRKMCSAACLHHDDVEYMLKKMKSKLIPLYKTALALYWYVNGFHENDSLDARNRHVKVDADFNYQ
jgi:hypothetical protein